MNGTVAALHLTMYPTTYTELEQYQLTNPSYHTISSEDQRAICDTKHMECIKGH